MSLQDDLVAALAQRSSAVRPTSAGDVAGIYTGMGMDPAPQDAPAAAGTVANALMGAQGPSPPTQGLAQLGQLRGAGLAPTPVGPQGQVALSPAPQPPMPPQVAPVPMPAPRPQPAVYVIKKGDTLTKIAKALGTTVAALVKANGIRNPDKIYVGHKLILPN